MNMRQILMMKTENEEHLELVKRACITRFGTELLVHLCVSTCDSK